MVVCLGWGSLIWNPGTLLCSGDWHTDGPTVPVEYLRESRNGRITLVIDPGVPGQTVLWTRMSTADPATARESLRRREGDTLPTYIGCWSAGEPCPDVIPGLDAWAGLHAADTVIWTGLPARFRGVDFRCPTLPEAIDHLAGLPAEKRRVAEEYVRRTPVQIRTPYRAAFEHTFGWTGLV